MESSDISFSHESTSNGKFRSHSASLLAVAKAAKSVAMVEFAIHVCLLEPKILLHHQVGIFNLTLKYNPLCQLSNLHLNILLRLKDRLDKTGHSLEFSLGIS